MKKTMTLIFFLSFILPTMAGAVGITTYQGLFDRREDRTISSKITIDFSSRFGQVPGQIIDKNFYGSHVDSYSPIPAKALIDELQLGKLRVGGNEYDVFNWKLNKSVNASGEIINVPGLDTLAKTINNYGVGGIFQLNLTGYQPELIDNNYVVQRTFTPASAYELIKYLNGTMNLKITDLSLGNEFSIWNETHSKIWDTQDGISADDYIDRYIQYAIAVRSAQETVTGDPNSIKLWGPEISTSWTDWNTGNFTKDCAWTDVKGRVLCSYGGGKFNNFVPYFLYRLKNAEGNRKLNPSGYKLLDYFSIHYYANFRTSIADPNSFITDSSGHQMVAAMLESTRVFSDPNFQNNYDLSSYKNYNPNILGRMKEWLKAGYPDAKLAINEFAVDSDYRTINYHPIVRPLYLADSIGIFAREGVAFFDQFLLSSQKEANLPWSMVNGGEKTNLFYMFKLFSNKFKGKVVPTKTNMGDLVNAYAVQDGNFVNLALVNKEPVERKMQIYVQNLMTKKLITYTIPGWSAAVLRFEKNPGLFAEKFEINEFGAKEMGIP